MQFDHAIDVDAPAATLWAMTLDVERWPRWTPTMTEVVRLDEGPLAVGSRARIRQPRQRPRIWTVTRLHPADDGGGSFEWEATMGSIRMRGGHHVTATGTGCRNRLTLELSGRGSRWFVRLAGRALARAIAEENAGFASAATGSQTPAG